MLQVTFMTSFPPYNAAETAGFDDVLAQGLVAKGVAVPTGAGWTPDPNVEAAALQAMQGDSSAMEAEENAAHLDQ